MKEVTTFEAMIADLQSLKKDCDLHIAFYVLGHEAYIDTWIKLDKVIFEDNSLYLRDSNFDTTTWINYLEGSIDKRTDDNKVSYELYYKHANITITYPV